ncbi:MAG: penicillin acylase family protein [Caldilineaceae bacterium]
MGTQPQLGCRIDAAAAAQSVGRCRRRGLEPNYPAQNPAVLEAVGEEELVRLQQTAGLLLNQYEQLKGWLGVAAEGQGSNAWVLAPKASLNRRPLLCNDPHLAVQIPASGTNFI